MTSRIKFLMMLGVFAVPMIAAWVSYFWLAPRQTRELRRTPPGDAFEAYGWNTPERRSLQSGAAARQMGDDHVGSSACNEACSRQLYYMRQVRIAQGKDQDRVERLWVITDAGTPDAVLLNSHPGLKVWRAGEAGFANQFPMEHVGATHIFLVDPLGNLMLRFPDADRSQGHDERPQATA